MVTAFRRSSACRRPSPLRGCSSRSAPAVLLVHRRPGLPEVRPARRHRRHLSSLNLIGTFWGVVLIQLVGTLLYMIWIPVAAFQGSTGAWKRRRVTSAPRPLRVFWSITLPQAGPTIGAAVLLTFVNTFYETEGAWLIGAPEVRTMPMLMISFINNQPVIQYGAVLSGMLWIPSFFALLFRTARHQRRLVRARLRRIKETHGGSRHQGRHQVVQPDRPRRGRFQPDGGRWRVGVPPRPVRLGQVDAAAHGWRLRDAEFGQHHHRRRGGHPSAAGAPADRNGVPEPRAVDPHERVQEHRLRPEAAATSRRTRSSAGRRRCWSSSASPATATGRRTSSRAASSSAWRLPGRWCWSRKSCCSTSRSRAWTSICANGCARKSATSSSG